MLFIRGEKKPLVDECWDHDVREDGLYTLCIPRLLRKFRLLKIGLKGISSYIHIMYDVECILIPEPQRSKSKLSSSKAVSLQCCSHPSIKKCVLKISNKPDFPKNYS